jgi:hypothetical protein
VIAPELARSSVLAEAAALMRDDYPPAQTPAIREALARTLTAYDEGRTGEMYQALFDLASAIVAADASWIEFNGGPAKHDTEVTK